jgi:hypothetical protein
MGLPPDPRDDLEWLRAELAGAGLIITALVARQACVISKKELACAELLADRLMRADDEDGGVRLWIAAPEVPGE